MQLCNFLQLTSQLKISIRITTNWVEVVSHTNFEMLATSKPLSMLSWPAGTATLSMSLLAPGWASLSLSKATLSSCVSIIWLRYWWRDYVGYLIWWLCWLVSCSSSGRSFASAGFNSGLERNDLYVFCYLRECDRKRDFSTRMMTIESHKSAWIIINMKYWDPIEIEHKWNKTWSLFSNENLLLGL